MTAFLCFIINSKRLAGQRGGQQQQQQRQRQQHPSKQDSNTLWDKESFLPGKKLNQSIPQQRNAKQLLSLLASTKGALTARFAVTDGILTFLVNLATAMHRVARHVSSYHLNRNNNNSNSDNESNKRSRILSDPRFELLVCSASDAIVNNENSIQDGPDQALR